MSEKEKARIKGFCDLLKELANLSSKQKDGLLSQAEAESLKKLSDRLKMWEKEDADSYEKAKTQIRDEKVDMLLNS
jgi:hypothetical protein